MSKLKHSLVALGAVTAIGAGTAVATTNASAHEGGAKDSLVEKLASKFNLNKDEVKQVFEENRAERQAKHQAEFEKKLEQLVADGKITSEQKDKITAKFAELKQKRESEKDSEATKEERKESFKKEREELKAWAEQNGIDLDLIKPEGGPGGHGGPHN